jgi:hypothetical protein
MSTMTQTSDVQDGARRLQQSAVALSLSLHMIGGRQRLEDDEYETGGSKEMVYATKKLFDKCPELIRLNGHLVQTKRWIETRSIPAGFKGGFYFIAQAAVPMIDEYLREREAGIAPLVEEFVEALDQRIAEARRKLGPLADNMRWPSPARIRSHYAIEWSWLLFETPTSLSRDIYDREVTKAQERVEDAQRNAIALLRAQMLELVRHMVDRLTPGDNGKARVFKNATVENLAEFLKTFDMRNLAGDGELEALVKKSARLLDGIDPKMLRDEEGVRTAVAQGFSKVKAQLDTLVVERPRRAIDFDDEE